MEASGDLREALKIYDKLISVNPAHPEYYLNRATLHVEMDSSELARKDLESARKLDPSNPIYSKMLSEM